MADFFTQNASGMQRAPARLRRTAGLHGGMLRF